MGNPTTDQKAHCFNDYFKQQQKISAYGIKPLTDIFQSAVLHNILSSQFENIPSSPPPPDWGLGWGVGGGWGKFGSPSVGKASRNKIALPSQLILMWHHTTAEQRETPCQTQTESVFTQQHFLHDRKKYDKFQLMNELSLIFLNHSFHQSF